MKAQNNALRKTPTDKVVYKSDDYSLFSYLDYNRPVNEARMRTIASSIERVGQQEPGLVSEEGKVLSGQGRLEACKHLKIPYEYIIGDHSSLRDDETVKIMLEIHKVQSTFTPNETLNCYCDLLRDDYLWLRGLKHKYNIAVANLLMVVASGWDKNHTIGEAFRNGDLIVSPEERIRVEGILEWIQELDDARPFQTKSRQGAFKNIFLKCMMSVLKWDESLPGLSGKQIHTFDRDRFLEQARAHRMRLEVNTELQWEEIEFVYNKGKKKKYSFPPMSLLDKEMSSTFMFNAGNYYNPKGKSKVIANGKRDYFN